MLHRAAFALVAAVGSSALVMMTPALATAPTVPEGRTPSVAPPAAAAKPVTRAQFAAQIDNNFKTIDTNGDKSLSMSEIEAAQARTAAQAQTMVIKRVETEFARMDANKDGQLSLGEYKAGAPAPRMTGAGQTLQRLDTNKDGKVGQDEFRAMPLANFDRLDSDKDGAISPQEQRAARAANAPRNP